MCFVTIAFGNSRRRCVQVRFGSARRSLTDVFATKAANVALPHCTTPPNVPRLSLSMYTYDFDQTLELIWDSFQVSHDNSSCASVALSGGCKNVRAISLTLYRDNSSFLAHAQQLSHCSSVHSDSVVGALRALLSRRFRILQSQHGNHVSYVLRICICRVSTLFSRSLCVRRLIRSLSCSGRPTMHIMTWHDKCPISR